MGGREGRSGGRGGEREMKKKVLFQPTGFIKAFSSMMHENMLVNLLLYDW